MIFYLTDSLVVAEADPVFNDIKRAVRNLATAACEGKHYILGDLKALRHFCQVFMSAKDDVSMLFDTLVQSYATQIVPSVVLVYVEVVNIEAPARRQQGNQEILQVSYKEFMDTRSVQATVLIGEDIEYDCWFYKYILAWYKETTNNKVSCQCSDRHGGGGRMDKVITASFRQKETSICFVDTDMRFPGQPTPSNSTYKKCMSTRKGVRNGVYPLDVHEVENLLPLNYIDQLQYDDKAIIRKQHFDMLRNNAYSEMVLKYLDLKEGLRKYNQYKDSEDFKSFVKTVCDMNLAVMDGMSFEDYYDSKNVDELLYPGYLMKRVLMHTIDLVKCNPTTLNEPELLPFQDAEWRRIGQLMVSFCFARRMESISN